MEEFCEGRIDLRYSPTAASAWNGPAENCIKQVNDQVAHKLAGSTDLDRYGRRVDGRFKSVNNARTAFTTIVDLFRQFVYEDLPSTPGADGLTPAARRDEAIAAYGSFGIPCEWNDDLLIRTSIRVRQKKSYDLQRGIRTVDGWFVSNELIEALRSHKPIQVRSDCCRPDVLWVQIDNRWIKAFHSRVQSIALLTEDERLYELLSAPITRADSRRCREEKARKRHSRQRLAEVAAPAIEHLGPTVPVEAPQNDPDSVSDRAPVTSETLEPYEEREDF
jgi:putative transposase